MPQDKAALNLGSCSECGCNGTAEDGVPELERRLEAVEGLLDCGQGTDCADEIETQEQCKKHYELYVEREIAQALAAKAEYAAALDRLQQRFNEVWIQHQAAEEYIAKQPTCCDPEDPHGQGRMEAGRDILAILEGESDAR